MAELETEIAVVLSVLLQNPSKALMPVLRHLSGWQEVCRAGQRTIVRPSERLPAIWI